MGTGNNDVGKSPLNDKASLKDLAGRVTMPATRPVNRCQGAMSQQGCGAHGNECYPQKFVQLVGYRGPQAKESWDRLRPKPAMSQTAE